MKLRLHSFIKNLALINIHAPLNLIIIVEICLFSLVFTSSIFGQHQDLLYKTFNNRNGLSQNSVYSIIQDKSHFLWLGTISGLNRFDGRNFTVFQPSHNNIQFSSIVHSLSIKDASTLYVGTSSHLLLFDMENDTFVDIRQVLPNFNLPDNISIDKIIVDEDDDLWIHASQSGLYHYSFYNHQLELYFDKNKSEEELRDISYHPTSGITIATNIGIYKIQNKKVRLHFKLENEYASQIKLVSTSKNFIAIGIDNVGVIFIHKNQKNLKIEKSLLFPLTDISSILLTNDSIAYIGSRSQALTSVLFHEDQPPIQLSTGAKGLSSNFILSQAIDNEGNIWVGTSGGGAAILIPQKNRFKTLKLSDQDKTNSGDNMIFGMHENTSDNKLYTGSLNKGLIKLDLADHSITAIGNIRYSSHTLNVYDVIEYRDTIWMATWGGLCYTEKNQADVKCFNDLSDKFKKFYSIEKINDSKLILGGENGLHQFNLSNHKFEIQTNQQSNNSIVIRDIHKWSPSIYLIATDNHGLVQYNWQEDLVTTIPEIDPYSRSIRHIYSTKDVISIASNNGIILIDPKSLNVLDHWTSESGLSDQFCYASLIDSSGHIWATHNQGLSRINLKDSSVTNFGLADGLQDLEFNTASAINLDNGNIVFGGIAGLNIINPNKLPEKYKPLKPNITSIKIDNKILKYYNSGTSTHKYKFKYSENLIAIEYSSISESYLEDITYEYRLEGLSERWASTYKNGVVNFTNLKPGFYKFFVRAVSRSGLTSEINNHFEFTIKPPFWSTWWFRSLLLLSAVILGVLIWNFQAQKWRMKNKMHKLENMALRSQMNPHFVFNTLNLIKYKAITGSKDEISSLIDDFAALMRSVLENSRKNLVTLETEFSVVEKYIILENSRLTDGFEFKLDNRLEHSLDQYFIPPMVLQPFVENAIRHGLIYKKGSKLLSITFEDFKSGYICTIEDNGIGREKHKAIKPRTNNKSIAIDLTRDRLKLITNGGHSSTVKIIDLYDDQNKPTGTKIELNFVNLKNEQD